MSRNYSANGLNQYTAVGAITPTYDARGNTQEAGGWQYYSYSSENMLTASWNETGINYDPIRGCGRSVSPTRGCSMTARR